MLINIYSDFKDKHFCLHINPDLTLGDFKVLCFKETEIPPIQMKVFLNSRPLSDDSKSLKFYNIAENDMFVIQRGIISSSPTPPNNSSTTHTQPPVKIDFSNVTIPVCFNNNFCLLLFQG